MQGLKLDFDTGDLIIRDSVLETSTIDNQNVALIATSQICRLLYPEVGAQLGSHILNRGVENCADVIATAVRMAEKDGATNVSIELNEEQLIFKGTYEN